MRANLLSCLPGPSSTERGFPVLYTGSPTVRPAIIEVSVDLSLTGILIALNGGGVTFKLDDLTHKLVPPDLHELIHL